MEGAQPTCQSYPPAHPPDTPTNATKPWPGKIVENVIYYDTHRKTKYTPLSFWQKTGNGNKYWCSVSYMF